MWRIPDDQLDPINRASLFTSYVRRKRWEAQLQAGELLSLLVKGFGLDKKNKGAGRGKSATPQKLSPEQLLAKLGG